MAKAETGGSRRRKPTSTSAFGVGRREAHDASDFYARFSPPQLSEDEQINDDPASRQIDRVIHGNSTDMSDVADGSVALVVTSPPYFAGKAYETELEASHVPATYIEYLEMLRDVFSECLRTLEPGGRIAVNVANLGRRPYRSLAADITSILQDDLRMLLRGEVVWVKQRGASGSCAWGSFQRATNPVLRDLTERVVIASKGRFDRPVSAAARKRRGLPYQSTMSSDEFMDATLDLWEIPPESARRVNHPAPFPVALPERLMNLYTYRGDLVLDPFMGSGSTAVAALRTDRHFVGYDTDMGYVEAANDRIEIEKKQLDSSDGSHSRAMPRVPSEPSDDESLNDRARREGAGAKKLVQQMLTEAGFGDHGEIVASPKVEGIEVSFAVQDAKGRRILIDCSGSFTATRPGLKRAETLWRALGRATALRHALGASDRAGSAGSSAKAASKAGARTDIVLMSTDEPSRRSAGGRALIAAMEGKSPAITDVLLVDGEGAAALKNFADGLRPADTGWAGSKWTSR